MNIICQPLTFLKTYNNGNSGFAVREINGNSYVSAGGTDFFDNWHWLMLSPHVSTNIHLLKTDDRGNLNWEKIYQNALGIRSMATWVEPTSDNGIILTGQLSRDLNWPPDSTYIILMKTDSNGIISWSKTFGDGITDFRGYCVKQTFDGGYIVSGLHTQGIPGPSYATLIKTDNNGIVIWSKQYSLAVRDLDTDAPFPIVVSQTADSGFVIVGTTLSLHAADVYVIKTTSSGNLLWAIAYSHDTSDFRFSVGLDIIETSGGDFIIAGSMDKDRLTQKFNYPYALKIDASGTFIKARFYETVPLLSFQSGFSSIDQTTDGGLFFTGMGGYSVFGEQAQLLKTDINLNMHWSRVYSFDGVATIGARSGRHTSDNGYIFTGKKQFSGSVLLKTDSAGLIQCKNPGTLNEIIPSVSVQDLYPVVSSGINSTNTIFNVLFPSTDTTMICNLFHLPVELINFSATPVSNNEAIVEWNTSSEINNDFFSLEKSEDAINFFEVTRIKGAGNSSFLNYYSYKDKNISFTEIGYYRLRQVDFNGKSVYSNIIAVKFTEEYFSLLNAYVDYSNHLLKINFRTSSSENTEYVITDLLGRIIFSGTKYSSATFNSINLDASNFSKGVYFFILKNRQKIVLGKIFYN